MRSRRNGKIYFSTLPELKKPGVVTELPPEDWFIGIDPGVENTGLCLWNGHCGKDYYGQLYTMDAESAIMNIAPWIRPSFKQVKAIGIDYSRKTFIKPRNGCSVPILLKIARNIERNKMVAEKIMAEIRRVNPNIPIYEHDAFKVHRPKLTAATVKLLGITKRTSQHARDAFNIAMFAQHQHYLATGSSRKCLPIFPIPEGPRDPDEE